MQNVLDMLDILNYSCYHYSKRSSKDCRTNGYNETIVKHGFANMDMKLIASPRSCVEYLTKYVFKSEPNREDEKPQLVEMLDHSLLYCILILRSNSDVEVSEMSPNDTPFQTFSSFCTQIRNNFSNTRKVTLNEILWRNANLDYKEFSNKAVFASVGGILSDYAMIQQNRSGLLQQSNDLYGIFDWQSYAHRPIELDFICFADFITLFQKKITVTEEDAKYQRILRTYDFEVDVCCVKERKMVRFYKKYDVQKTSKYEFCDWGMQKETDRKFYTFFHPWREETTIPEWCQMTDVQIQRINDNWKKHRGYQMSFGSALSELEEEFDEDKSMKEMMEDFVLYNEDDDDDLIKYSSKNDYKYTWYIYIL